MTTFGIYTLLLLVKALYAWLLSRLPAKWIYPDLTWVFVAIGVALCLVAASIDRRLNGPYTAEGYELRVWGALLVGGVPIAIWQVSRSVSAGYRWLMRHLRSRDYGNAPNRPTRMAADPGETSEDGN